MRYLWRIVGLLVFAYIITFYVDIGKVWKSFDKGMITSYLLAAITVLLFLALKAFRWQYILLHLGVSYPLLESFKANAIELGPGQVLPIASPLLKVLYIPKNPTGSLLPFAAVAAEKFFDFLLPVFLGITCGIFILLEIDPTAGVTLIFGATLGMYFPFHRAAKAVFLANRFPRIQRFLKKKGIDVCQNSGHILRILNMKVYFFSLAILNAYYFTAYLFSVGLRLEMSFPQVFYIFAFTSLLAMLPVSFLGIGTRDAALAATFYWFGKSVEEAVALSLALLSLRLLMLFAGLIVWMIFPPPDRKAVPRDFS